MTDGRLLQEILSWVKAFAVAIVLALLIRAFIMEPVRVDGPSMKDTLVQDERLIVEKVSYLFADPEPGDIVVLEMNTAGGFWERFIPFLGKRTAELDLIKRVVGAPGDVMEIRNGQVYRNGEALQESYARGLTYPAQVSFPLTVPSGQYFVLGDNRQNSSDSRYFGCVDRKRIRGRAVFRIFPFNRIGGLTWK